MKAVDIKKGDHLYWGRWRRSPEVLGSEVVVIDPRPIFGRSNRWSTAVAEGHGRGVLVDVLDSKGTFIERRAVLLQDLYGPYRETKRRFSAQLRAEDKARNEARARAEQAVTRSERLVKRGRRRGIHDAYAMSRGNAMHIEVSLDTYEAILRELEKHAVRIEVES